MSKNIEGRSLIDELDKLESIVAGSSEKSHKEIDFDEHLHKCLSMVSHHSEVQQIIQVIKKVHEERTI